MNSYLTLLWGFFIFIISALLYSLGGNPDISGVYFFISMFCGIFLIVFRKEIPIFSPIFMLISSVYVNFGFPSLYFLLNKTNFSHELMKEVSILYVVYFISLMLPVFYVNQMFQPQKDNNNNNNNQDENSYVNKFNPFKLNLGAKSINLYLLFSNLIIIFMVFLLLKYSGFDYLAALKNPLAFRFEASSGWLSYIRKIIFLVFMLNTFILAKYTFTQSEQKPIIRLPNLVHIVLLIVFGLISGSRSIFILPVISAIAVYSFYNRLKIKTILSFSILFVIALSVISLYGAYRDNSKLSYSPELITNSFDKTNMLSLPLKRLDSFKNSLYFFEYIDREHNTIFYFKDFKIIKQIENHLTQPFSRDWMPDKGYYFSSLMTGTVFNINLSEAKVTYNFGGISNAFWNFGLAGIVLEGLLLGVAVVWLHRKFLEYINYDSFFLFFMITFFFIPNSIIVDGFWNTMDGCVYFLNLIITLVIVLIIKILSVIGNKKINV